MGVSVETRRYYYRIHDLTATPAHVKFLSLEPRLEPLASVAPRGDRLGHYRRESSLDARPLDPAWRRDILAQCQTAGVACFVKQLGTVWAKAHGDTTRKGGEWRRGRSDSAAPAVPIARSTARAAGSPAATRSPPYDLYPELPRLGHSTPSTSTSSTMRPPLVDIRFMPCSRTVHRWSRSCPTGTRG